MNAYQNSTDELFEEVQLSLLGALIDSEGEPLTTPEKINTYLENSSVDSLDLLVWQFEEQLASPILNSKVFKGAMSHLEQFKGMFKAMLPDVEQDAETVAESTFNAKTGEFEKGEGSILLNKLLEAGVIDGSKESANKFFEGDSVEVVKKIAAATQGMDQKQLTFALEAFGSDLTNVVVGMRSEEFKTASANATTFNDSDMADANRFMSELNKFTSQLAAIPLGMFKEFTNSLSPSTLEMFGKIGKVLSNVATVFGEMLSVVLNVISLALNPLLDVFVSLTDASKATWSALAEGVEEMTTWLDDLLKPLQDALTATINAVIDSVLSIVPDFMLPDDLKSENRQTKPIIPNTPVATTPKPTTQTVTVNQGNSEVAVYSTLTLDGNVVARQVVNTEAFKNAQYSNGWY
ncbi:hypothetical protein QTN94_10535 [Vibrio sp. M250220]|uniref:hypothetical protein n=1 Tax=Vibrio sp. M250220 TaxID=3020894 RepID=UPI002F41BF25